MARAWTPVRDRTAFVGLRVWTGIGIGVLVVAGWLLATRMLFAVLVPLVLALFPAALLMPAVNRVSGLRLGRRSVPRAAAVAVVLLGAALIGGSVVGLVVPVVLAQLPELTRTVAGTGDRLEALLHNLPFVADTATPSSLFRQLMGSVSGVAAGAARTTLSVLVGLALLLVVLALYLAGGRRIVATGLSVVPRRHRDTVRTILELSWGTLSDYIRGLFLVALFDATSIGLGLWLLEVPLVLPLTVLVFFGAFVPYAGAFVSGLTAVAVAFAVGGPASALWVLLLIVIVQQVEGNIVQPLLMGRVVAVSAFTVIVAIGVGASLLGVLGAFLAVPVAACTARVIRHFRAGGDDAPPGAGTGGEHPDKGMSRRVGGG